MLGNKEEMNLEAILTIIRIPINFSRGTELI